MPKVRKSEKEKVLGTIRTKAVGLQYYDAEVQAGMTISLERERDNPHDENAVRVENADFDPVGHVPRKVASWLAPLIDEGKIRAGGRIGSGEAFQFSAPLEISVTVAPKGKGILRRCRKPATASEAIHQMVLGVFRQSESWDDPRILTDLSIQLQNLHRADILPETRLLLELLPERASEIRRKQARRECSSLIDTLESVRIGGALHHRNLTVFPLYLTNGHDPQYMLLGSALEKDLAEVTEVSDSGNVPELRLVNRGDKPILIPEGEIVVGGKQNRTINITILVAAGATFTLPVSCVEQGRWHRMTDRFETRFHAPPNLRAHKMRSVRRNRAQANGYESDQGQVWEDVACCLREAGASSETSSLTDGYEQAAERIAEYRKHIDVPTDASGILVLHGGEVVGLDLFDHHDTLEHLWPRLAEAYFLAFAAKPDADPGRENQAQAFLSRLGQHLAPSDETLGLGQSYDIEAADLIGSALWYDGRPCHVSAFPDKAVAVGTDDENPWADY